MDLGLRIRLYRIEAAPISSSRVSLGEERLAAFKGPGNNQLDYPTGLSSFGMVYMWKRYVR